MRQSTLLGSSLVLLAAATVAMSSAPAIAQDERPCREDVLNYCADQIGNREDMRACMRENFSQFSEQCQASIRERMQQRNQNRPSDSDQPANPPE